MKTGSDKETRRILSAQAEASARCVVRRRRENPRICSSPAQGRRFQNGPAGRWGAGESRSTAETSWTHASKRRCARLPDASLCYSETGERALSMRPRTALAVGFLGLISAWGVVRAQRPFKEYPALEYENFPIPSDFNTKTEWVRARLRYPDIYGYPQRRLQMRNGREYPGYWTMDYPRSDRHLLAAVRRLTRIDTRLAEQVVDLDGTADIYNWPVMYGVEVGHWLLPDDQAAQFRDYLNRGGFFMCDDFHGDEEWHTFVTSMQKVLPGRPIEDIPDNDPIFHTLF